MVGVAKEGLCALFIKSGNSINNFCEIVLCSRCLFFFSELYIGVFVLHIFLPAKCVGDILQNPFKKMSCFLFCSSEADFTDVIVLHFSFFVMF